MYECYQAGSLTTDNPDGVTTKLIDMPFKSKAQAKYMFANHPAMAKEWAKETKSIKSLPKKKKKKK